jgi:hypothetical protein
MHIRRKILKKLFKFSVETTSHGLPRIVLAKNPTHKLFWLVFWLVAIVLCTYMVISNINKYFKFEVTTKIQVVSHETMVFPMVTVCQVTPFVAAEAVPYVTEYLQNKSHFNISKYFIEPYQNLIVKSVNITEWLQLYTSVPYFNTTLRDSFNYWPENGFRLFWFDKEFFELKNESLPLFYHPEYGQCLRINSGRDSHHKPQAVRTISQEERGMYLDVFAGMPPALDEQTRHKHFHRGYGVYVYFDDQSTHQYRHDGIFLPTNAISTIKLSRSVSKRMPHPYSKCVDVNSDENKTPPMLTEMRSLGINYGHRNCLTYCEETGYFLKYGCYRLILLPLLNLNLSDALKMPWCLSNDLLLNSSRSVDMSECTDSCAFECHTVSYEATVTISSKWDFNLKSYFNDSFLERTLATANVTNEMIKENMILIEAVYDDLVSTEITEQPTVSGVEFIANLGGLIGLFLGVSMLSFVEILELLCQLIAIFCKTQRSRPVMRI